MNSSMSAMEAPLVKRRAATLRTRHSGSTTIIPRLADPGGRGTAGSKPRYDYNADDERHNHGAVHKQSQPWGAMTFNGMGIYAIQIP